MSVEGVLALLLIVALDTIAATSREIRFKALNMTSPRTTNVTKIPNGCNLTLLCDCERCSTIDFMKNGNVNFSRYYTGNYCQINGKKADGCNIHFANYTFKATPSLNNTKWFCRGTTIQEEARSSLGQLFVITQSKTSSGNKETSTGNKETSTGNKETSTGVIETTTSTGLGTSGPEVQTPTEVNQNNLTIISAVTTVLVVVLVVVTVILCLKKRKNKRVTKLNGTSPEDKRAVKETPGSRESLCVMEENEIYESNDGGFVNQDSTTENRKSICIMEANPLYEIT